MTEGRRIYKMPKLVSVSLMSDGSIAPAVMYPSTEQWRDMIREGVEEYIALRKVTASQVLIYAPTEEIAKEVAESEFGLKCKGGWVRVVHDDILGRWKDGDLPYVVYGLRRERYA